MTRLKILSVSMLGVAIAACGLVNFAVSDQFVFQA